MSSCACPGASPLGEFPCLAMSTCWPSRGPGPKASERSWVAAPSTGRIWQRRGSPQRRNATATSSSPASASTTTEREGRHSEEGAFNVDILQHCLLTVMSSGFPNFSSTSTVYLSFSDKIYHFGFNYRQATWTVALLHHTLRHINNYLKKKCIWRWQHISNIQLQVVFFNMISRTFRVSVPFRLTCL